MGRGHAIGGATALLALFCLTGAGALASEADGGPEVLSVSPSVAGETLICRVRTTGLPTDEAARSMGGGLPSSIDLLIDLVDEEGTVLLRRRLTFRVAFDLWEEVFRVDDGVRENRLDTLDSVRDFLSDMERLPIASVPSIVGNGRLRLRVGIVSHTIAPAEKTRIGEWIAGDGGSGTDRDVDGREVSLGLGSLIRYFFGESAEGKEAPVGVGVSDWFRLEDLGEEEKDA